MSKTFTPNIVSKWLLVLVVNYLIYCMPFASAIEIANGFSYDGQTGFEASRTLATDYVNFPEFQAVGLLNIEEGEDLYRATGTLINREWVITAAHNWNTSSTSIEFVLGDVVYQADMTQLYQHPLWAASPKVGPEQGWDIALFRLTTPITEDILFPQLYTKTDERTQTSIILGAGQFGTGTTSWEKQPYDDPLVHAAYNIVDRTILQIETLPGDRTYTGGFLVNDFDGAYDPNQNTLSTIYESGSEPWTWNSNAIILKGADIDGEISGRNSLGSQFMLNNNILEGAMAPGDSGGPTFILDGDTWKIAGITSWGTNPWDYLFNGSREERGLYGEVNYATRVSQHIDWIYSIIPEPSTNALLAFGLLLLVASVAWARYSVSVPPKKS